MKRILVVGSLNMDIVIETPCMPKAGETIAGKSIAQIPGGKVPIKHLQQVNWAETLP